MEPENYSVIEGTKKGTKNFLHNDHLYVTNNYQGSNLYVQCTRKKPHLGGCSGFGVIATVDLKTQIQGFRTQCRFEILPAVSPDQGGINSGDQP